MTDPQTARPSKVLVVDDEVAILQTLRYNLEKNGYVVCVAGDGRQALSVVEIEKPDLILLDVMLPSLDGIEVCREIRRRSNVPILMLTAKGQEIDKVLGLEIGADDYITKPFSIHEVIARIRAHLRRANAAIHQEHPPVLSGGDVRLDVGSQSVTKRGAAIDLAPKEFGVLQVLLENKGRVVTRQALLDRVWGFDFYGDQQTVNVHIRWLREKIEDDPNDPKWIHTIRSRGYVFRD
ncbi:MAG: response regulator [Candidatus Eremiobacterales bacterium]|jgi:two-component system OmpR family response regulator/two-component system alkaline phosphatase synthesis response regulator PhoP